MELLGSMGVSGMTVRSTGGAGVGPGGDLAGAQEDFASVIARAKSSGGADPAREQEEAHRAAQDFVAATLIQPLLKQLRETSQAAPPFAPSRGEQQFQAMADAQIAQRIVRAKGMPIVEAVERSLLRKPEKLDGDREGRAFGLDGEGASGAAGRALPVAREPAAIAVVPASGEKQDGRFIPLGTKEARR